MKKKKFDCVKMKDDIQKKMLEDEKLGKKVHETKDIFFYRFDISFLNSNPNTKIEPSKISKS